MGTSTFGNVCFHGFATSLLGTIFSRLTASFKTDLAGTAIESMFKAKTRKQIYTNVDSVLPYHKEVLFKEV